MPAEPVPEPTARLHHDQTHPLHHAGHYIVVVAYCASSDSYEVRDPAAEAGHLTVPAAVLEAARRSFGTDEDIILVRTPSVPGPCRAWRPVNDCDEQRFSDAVAFGLGVPGPYQAWRPVKTHEEQSFSDACGLSFLVRRF